MSDIKDDYKKFKADCKQFKEKMLKKMGFKENSLFLGLFFILTNLWIFCTVCLCEISGIKANIEFKFLVYLSVFILIQSIIAKVSRIDYLLYYFAFIAFFIFVESYVGIGH